MVFSATDGGRHSMASGSLNFFKTIILSVLRRLAGVDIISNRGDTMAMSKRFGPRDVHWIKQHSTAPSAYFQEFARQLVREDSGRMDLLVKPLRVAVRKEVMALAASGDARQERRGFWVVPIGGLYSIHVSIPALSRNGFVELARDER